MPRLLVLFLTAALIIRGWSFAPRTRRLSSLVGEPQEERSREQMVASPSPDALNSGIRLHSTRSSSRTFAKEDADDEDLLLSQQRRRLLTLWTVAAAPLFLTTKPSSASARGLVQFPCKKPLGNTYHLLRAGTSLLEEQGMWSTNPLFLTNRDDALSVAGEEQVVRACQLLKQDAPTLVKYSLAASAIDTSNIIGRELKLGRDRLVPEFTFLDPRAIGSYDMTDKSFTQPAIFALDNDEAGKDGLQGRPPANEDGTPNETLADQAVRLRQVLSILESQYFSDTILLVFPDGTGPALLSAMIAGIPYNRAHELEFAPGEVRLDVNLESTLALWKTKQLENGEAYQATLQQGRENLKQLRAGKGTANLKDEKLEKERIAIETQMAEKEQKRVLAVEQENQRRLQRQREISAEREADDSKISPTVLGVASAVGVAGIAVTAMGSAASNDDNKQQDLNATNATLPETAPILGDNNVTLTENVLPTGPILDLNTNAGADLYSTSVATTTRTSRQRVNGDRNGNFTATLQQEEQETIDPKVAAERAMEEYMNQDDGASDWLLSLSEILDEEEDLVMQSKDHHAASDDDHEEDSFQ